METLSGRKRRPAVAEDRGVARWIAEDGGSSSDGDDSSGSDSDGEAPVHPTLDMAAIEKLVTRPAAAARSHAPEPLEPTDRAAEVEDAGGDYTAKPWPAYFLSQVRLLGEDCTLPLLVDSRLGTAVARTMMGADAKSPAVVSAATEALHAFRALRALPTPLPCTVYMGSVLPGHPPLPAPRYTGDVINLRTLRIGVLDPARVNPGRDVFAFEVPAGSTDLAALFAFMGDEGTDVDPIVMLNAAPWRCNAVLRRRLPVVPSMSVKSEKGGAVLRPAQEAETAREDDSDSEGGESPTARAAAKYAHNPTTIFKLVPA